MKKPRLFLLIGLVSLFVVAACNSDKNSEQKEGSLEDQISEFKDSLSEIDEALDLADFLNENLEMINKKVASGELDRKEANKITNDLINSYKREIAKRSNLNPTTSLPEWAIELGLTEPKGMTIDADFSSLTSVDDEDNGYNSVKLIYQGEYRQALNQASIIAAQAKIPMSKEYKDAMEKAKKYPSARAGIRGVSYMNYEFGEEKTPTYKISITVNKKGELTINAVNEIQRKTYLDKMRGE
jgi:hypothetical protein